METKNYITESMLERICETASIDPAVIELDFALPTGEECIALNLTSVAQFAQFLYTATLLWIGQNYGDYEPEWFTDVNSFKTAEGTKYIFRSVGVWK